MELLLIALGMDADLRSFGGDEDLSHFRTGEVTDDVTGGGSHPHR